MAFFRGGRRADWKNGGIALFRAQKQLKEGAWPVGHNDDKSIVWQGHPRNKNEGDRYIQPAVYFSGDYLVYGGIKLASLAALTGYLLLCWAIPNYIWTGEYTWMRQSANISVVLGVLFLYYSIFSRFSHFVVFDRRNQLVHISYYFGRRFHSVTWQDFDYIVLDCHTSSFGTAHSAEIRTAPPPWSLEKHGLPFSWNLRSRLIEREEEAYITDRAPRYRIERTVELIIDFMSQRRTHPQLIGITKDMDKQLTVQSKDDYKHYRRSTLKPWALIDPEKLPDEPNWKKNEHGNWEKLHRGTIARAGLFGLWGISHTLPPYLRGTRADPAYKKDQDAPRPGLRWYSHENEGTGELVNQPDDVVEAVLTEGMSALERFPEAAERARKARENAVTYHNKNQSWVVSPDA
ncbi:MAG: hypothetical protein LAT61_11060 [Alcanivorax sp.]|nr:hypothetical protein [Alcanivorax sp.]